jgi:hypothetical protein
MLRSFLNCELERMWKEAVVTYFKVFAICRKRLNDITKTFTLRDGL